MLEKITRFILILVSTFCVLYLPIQYPPIVTFIEKYKLILLLIGIFILFKNLTSITYLIKNFSLREDYKYLKVEWLNGIFLGIVAFLVANDFITSFSTKLVLIRVLFILMIIQIVIFYKCGKKNKELYVLPSSSTFFDIINKTQPITNITEDQLNVSKWVEKVSNLLQSNKSAILTIGINGKWGAGKTSLINLISNELPKNSFLQFSSWDYLNNNKLTEYLLNKIGCQLDKLTKRINFFSNLFDSLYFSASNSPVKGINLVYKTTVDLFSKKPKEKLKIKLRDELAHPLIIFVDDLDRLDKKAFLDVIKSIYLLADLPNIRFVLAYDKSHVLNILFKDDKHSKSIDYFSKLINFEFNLNVHPEQIRRDFFVKILEEYKGKFHIDEVMGLISFANEDTYAYHIFKLLETPREIRKILAFSMWACIDEKGGSNFDMVDMFILAVIQYRIPKLYNIFQKKSEEIKNKLCSGLKIKPFNYAVSLQENKKYLKDNSLNKQKITDSEVLKELFDFKDIEDTVSQEIFEDLLSRLFPPLLTHESTSLDKILKQKRICHPAVWESYLNLESESYSSQYIKIVETLMNIKSDDYDAYGAFISKYKTELMEHNLWEDFIKYNLMTLDAKAIESFIVGIFKISKSLETDDYHNLSTESYIYSRRVCQLLASLKVKDYDDDQIYEILKDIIKLQPSYGVFSFTIYVFFNSTSRFLGGDYQIKESERDKFKDMLIGYANEYFFSDNNQITKYDFHGLIFWTVHDSNTKDKVLQIIQQDRKLLFWLLDFFVRYSSSIEDLDKILGYHNVKKIVDKIESFNSLQMSEQNLIRNFLEVQNSIKTS